jgi:oligopeptide/dipeptide ABC transporter ATP-binding protein
MAVLLQPKILIADEPTTALDPSLQTQVLELFAELQRRHGLALLLISHDLVRVARFADRVHVLYAGRTAESAPARELFRRPLHPYTRGLLDSTLRLDVPATFPLPAIRGQPPELGARPSGCAFHPRCALAREACRESVPELVEPRPGRRTACIEIASLLAPESRTR